MTPLEIFEYRLKWMPGHQVEIHSDLRDRAIEWCRGTMDPAQWKMSKWIHSDVKNLESLFPPYIDTFYFESFFLAKMFAETFSEYTRIIDR